MPGASEDSVVYPKPEDAETAVCVAEKTDVECYCVYTETSVVKYTDS